MKIVYKLNENTESIVDTKDLTSIYIDRNQAKIVGKSKNGSIIDIYYPYFKVYGGFYSPKGIIPENVVFADLENQLNFLSDNHLLSDELILKYVY